MATASGWGGQRQHARQLETQTEKLFHTYSQFATATNIPSTPSAEEQRVETQLLDVLQKASRHPTAPPDTPPLTPHLSPSIQREHLIGHLTRQLDSESANEPAPTLKRTNLARHAEMLAEHRRDLHRLQATLRDARNRANLLSNVRSDIDAYRASVRRPEGDREADYMLDERARIEHSHGMVDSVLSQAYAVNESFSAQRETLASINRRIVAAASHVPGINSLVGRIGARKRRDSIMLAALIATCLVALLYFR
ncbi:MAG: hypothetical protein M1826_006985 [Phylliscum demangeonii]|nr:MAG: hypothetical protein M1826_006985 [Phylliscum demangeonii]